MSIVAIVQDDMIKLPPDCHVPNGTEVTVELPRPYTPPSRATIDAWLKKASGAAKSGLTTDEIMRLTRGED